MSQLTCLYDVMMMSYLRAGLKMNFDFISRRRTHERGNNVMREDVFE